MRGGDMLVADHRFKMHGHNSNHLYFYRSSNQVVISFFSAFMILINGSVAVNYLKLGSYFGIGIIQAILLSLIPFLLSQLSFYIFFRSWVFGSKFTYPGIWVLVFGPLFQLIPQILVIYSYFNFTFKLVTLIPEIWKKFFNDLCSSPPNILLNDWFIVYLVGFISVFPFLFAKRLSSLRYMSYVANSFLVLNILCIIIDFFMHIDQIDSSKLPLFGGNYHDSMRILIQFQFAFYFHPLLQLSTEDLDNPTNFRISGLTWSTSSTKFAIFTIIPILNFCSYYSRNHYSEKAFLDNYEPKNVLTIFIEISLYANILLTIALFTYIIAHSLNEMFLVKRHKRMATIFGGLCAFLLNSTICFVSENVKKVLNIIGSFSICILVYFLPPLYSIALYKTKDILWFILSLFLLAAGVTFSILIITQQIQDF